MDGRNFDELTKKLANGASRRSFLKGVFGGGAALVAAKATGTLAQKGPAPKKDICHATASADNPYVKLKVSANSLWTEFPDRVSSIEGHENHTTDYLLTTEAGQVGCCTDKDCKCENQCEAAVCNGAGTETAFCGACAPVEDDTLCNDGNACTQTDTCQEGTCVGTDPVTCNTPPNDQCYEATGTCNTTTGACSYTPKARGASCNDNNACTQTDVCDGAGTCVGTNPVVCDTPPNDQCYEATGTCNPRNGSCSYTPLARGTECDDGNACTQTDACNGAGTCVGINPVVCDTPPNDQCYEATGTCNTTTGACSYTPLARGTECDDGNACTQTDACNGAGTCVGINPVVCTALDQCHVAGVCDTATGLCSNPNARDGIGCNDGNACTQTDTCQAGTCVGTNPVVCTALDQCHVAGVCDTASGLCSNPNARDGIGCNDGNACTHTDVCSGGVCAGQAVTCPANTTCTTYSCDGTDTCAADTASQDGGPCNDGNACTGDGTCSGGTCQQGDQIVTCAVLDQCHVVGACDPGSGLCSNPNAPNGTACNADNNACTVGDSCQNGSCLPGTPVVCNDNNECTDNSCNPANGTCVYTPVQGRSCNGGAGTCNASGQCVAANACGTCNYDTAYLRLGTCIEDNGCNTACEAYCNGLSPRQIRDAASCECEQPGPGCCMCKCKRP